MADLDKNTLALEVCAIDRAPIKLDAVEVSLPGVLGVFVVLPGHAPLLSNLEVGTLGIVQADGDAVTCAINGGFAQVLENRVLVLTQTAELDSEIDIQRAHDARVRAEQRLKKPEEGVNVARAEGALKRALSRIKAAEPLAPATQSH